MSDQDATKPTLDFQKTLDEINQKFRGHARRVRIIIAEAQYALALHEGELGVPSVRENWERYFDKIWRARRDPELRARETLLHAVVSADRYYSEPHVGWQRPRATFEAYMGTDANGRVLTWTASLPFELEAAQRAIKSVSTFDPETAEKIPEADLAAIIPVFAKRHENPGRRGKPVLIDAELCKLVKEMGLTPVTTEAMRRQRTKFETSTNQRRVEEVRARHLEAMRRERVAHGLAS
jgi:hypothetical protein